MHQSSLDLFILTLKLCINQGPHTPSHMTNLSLQVANLVISSVYMAYKIKISPEVIPPSLGVIAWAIRRELEVLVVLVCIVSVYSLISTASSVLAYLIYQNISAIKLASCCSFWDKGLATSQSRSKSVVFVASNISSILILPKPRKAM